MNNTLTVDRPDTLEDLEFAPPCGWHIRSSSNQWQPACEHPAAWFGVFNCCGHGFLLCDSHKERQASAKNWECLGCQAKNVTAIHWERL